MPGGRVARPVRRVPLLLGRFAGCRGGNTSIELAFVLPALVVLLLGAMELGRGMWLRNTLQYAMEETGRYAMTRPGSALADLVDYGEARLLELTSAPVVLTASRDTIGGIDYATLIATAQFDAVIPIAALQFEITGRSRVPMLDP